MSKVIDPPFLVMHSNLPFGKVTNTCLMNFNLGTYWRIGVKPIIGISKVNLDHTAWFDVVNSEPFIKMILNMY